MAVRSTRPIWFDLSVPQYPPLTNAGRFDVVVIGGGVTGLTAALFLKQAGKTVCLVERDRIGTGDSGHTTAHLTCVTDLRLKRLVDTFGRDQAALTWFAGAVALAWIEKTILENQIVCHFRHVPAFLHASLENQKDETEELREEVELAGELGFDADFVQRAPLVNRPAMRVRNQAKLHPRAYLAGLASLVDGHGSAVHEQCEVTEVEDDPQAVVASGVRIACDHIVLATQIPLQAKSGLLKAALLQSKLIPRTSYVVSGRTPSGSCPEVSLWDTSDPYYYLRVDAERGFDRVLFGGNDHKTGQVEDTEDCYRRLEEKLLAILPAIDLDHRWSGQVIETSDGLPLIGETAERQFVATGFNGNGYTFATIAGMMIRDAILQQENPWRELFAVDRKQVRGGTWDYIKQNLDYPYYFLTDRLRRPNITSTHSIPPGSGAVIKIDGRRVACSRDEHGEIHQVSAVCPHLGCLVRWNPADQTWDCPCHGSRFQPTGEMLAGPAESALEQILPSESQCTAPESAPSDPLMAMGGSRPCAGVRNREVTGED